MTTESQEQLLAKQVAVEVAAALGVTLVRRASYTYAATGAAAAWRIAGNKYGARLAVNVEDYDNPIPLLETGSLARPIHHASYTRWGNTWVEASPIGGPQLVNPLGSWHPILVSAGRHALRRAVRRGPPRRRPSMGKGAGGANQVPHRRPKCAELRGGRR